jgi:uroporphyrinogen-III synthase
MTQKTPLLIMIRPALQSSQTVQALTERLGHLPNVVISPLITIHDLDVQFPSDLSWPVIFTSQNAVSIASRKTKLRGDVYCVGQKVACLAKSVGFKPVAVFRTAQEMFDHGLPSVCTYLRGEQISLDISCANGCQVNQIVLYTQMPLVMGQSTKNQLAQECVIPVYSENSANRLIEYIDSEMKSVSVICISENAALPLRKAGIEKITVVKEPTSDAMLDALAVRL